MGLAPTVSAAPEKYCGGKIKKNLHKGRAHAPEYRLAALHLRSNSSSAVSFWPSSNAEEKEWVAVPAALRQEVNCSFFLACQTYHLLFHKIVRLLHHFKECNSPDWCLSAEASSWAPHRNVAHFKQLGIDRRKGPWKGSQAGIKSTRKPPGAVAMENCSVALSANSTKGSLFSLTSYP